MHGWQFILRLICSEQDPKGTHPRYAKIIWFSHGWRAYTLGHYQQKYLRLCISKYHTTPYLISQCQIISWLQNFYNALHNAFVMILIDISYMQDILIGDSHSWYTGSCNSFVFLLRHLLTNSMTNIDNKAIRDGKYLAPPHASAWQRSLH